MKSFKALPMDMTASSLEGKRVDQNGDVAALIKVVTSETEFTFEGGALGIVDTRQRNGEIWVWVPRGLRKITVLHQKLGVLRDYRFPVEIEAERTYEMVLTTGKVKTYIEEETTEQWLVFEITPHDAILEVDDKMWPVSAEGTARSLVPFGTYTYRVQAQNYHPEVGRVEVNDPENSQVVPVTLAPNFGWLEVPGDNGLSGAVVYIDNALIGKAPCKSEALKSGSHNVRILKELYEPYTTTVTVNDNETTRVAPVLTSNFAHLTLQVDADAEIWVNDELKGTRTWTGDLLSGTYRIECKQEGHEPTTTKKIVTNSMNGEVITLEAPIPIYGSLNVECTPDLATLYIDGKDMGKTPKLIGKILVGTHELRLSKSGYADHTETVTITQGVRAQVTVTLTLETNSIVATSGGGSTSDSGSGGYGGHDYVDLGLPSGTLWATCNIGASKPEEYGDYFAWGETTTKSTYDWSTYKYCKGSNNMLTKYCYNSSYGYNGFTDNLTVLQSSDDAATANWGSGWCMPTKAQWEELKDNTSVTWTTQNGVNGRKFTASNGNSLFLPAAGGHYNDSLYGAGSYGYYWSSSLNSDYPNCAWELRFNSDYYGMYYGSRYCGQSVRPVRSSGQN